MYNSGAQYFNLTNNKMIHSFTGHKGGQRIHDVILLPDKKTFLTWTQFDNAIKYWDLSSGKELYTFEGHTSDVLNVVLLQNTNTFLTTSLDRTIKHWDLNSKKILGTFVSRYGQIKEIFFLPNTKNFISLNQQNSITLWDLKNYKELCTLIPKAGDNKDFVITTPEGYYMASKGGVNDLVHYVLGNQVYLFDQFDLQYNRPDKVLEAIGLASDTLIQVYKQAYIKRLQKTGISEARIPFFVNSEFDKDFNAPMVELSDKQGFVYETTNQANYPVRFRAKDAKYNLERIQVNVDRVPLYGARGLEILKRKSKIFKDTTLNVPLHQGENIITIRATNEQGVASLDQRLVITYTPPAGLEKKPTLHVISIGVNQYQDNRLATLDFAAKDAQKIAELFQNQKAQYAKVVNHTLVNEQVTRDTILKLKKELLQTNPNDMVIFSFSGHGFLEDKSYDYYLATHNTNLDKLAQTGLKYDMVEKLLDSIPARKKLMLIDACHSGEIQKAEVRQNQANSTEKRTSTRVRTKSDGSTYKVNELSQDAFEIYKATFADLRVGTGTTVISASGGLQKAGEYQTFGHAAFTFGLIKGLEQKEADLDKNGEITISELQKYLEEEIPRLTDGTQKPTSRIENIVNDFRVW